MDTILYRAHHQLYNTAEIRFEGARSQESIGWFPNDGSTQWAQIDALQFDASGCFCCEIQ